MAIVSLSENQIKQVHSYVDMLDFSKNKDNYFVGKCGEIAVLEYGLNSKLYNNLYGYDLFDSVLKNTRNADLGHDLILQASSNKYIKVFAQVKTIACEYDHNLCLDKKLYNEKLEYYNGIPQDVYILVKRLSESTYDIVGYITHDDAAYKYKDDYPVKGCYCINENQLKPIENIESIFKK